MIETPDPRPGYYYVSVMRDDGDWRPLRGPYKDDHAAALAAVDAVRDEAQRLDPRGCFYSYGTIRSESDLGPGILGPAATETRHAITRDALTLSRSRA